MHRENTVNWNFPSEVCEQKSSEHTSEMEPTPQALVEKV